MQNQELVSECHPVALSGYRQGIGPYFFTSSLPGDGFCDDEGAKSRFVWIDMASRDEYILQRPGAYYFFEEGKKRGVKSRSL